MLFPRTCPLCNRPGPAPCGACVADLERAPALLTPPGLDSCAAVVAYVGAGRELVARLKYRNARSTLAWLAASMSSLAPRDEIEVVTWIPTSNGRRRARGFDQAELLARAVARRLQLPSRRLLVRLPGPSQTGRSLEQRRLGPAFRGVTTVHTRVLVVDDVITTGSTMSAAASALRDAGIRHVSGVAGARTPLKRRTLTPENS